MLPLPGLDDPILGLPSLGTPAGDAQNAQNAGGALGSSLQQQADALAKEVGPSLGLAVLGIGLIVVGAWALLNGPAQEGSN